ncbi:MAG: hypothetical protein GWN71_10265, partial [Gammaproteobacteria bacterium]|nr:hypothetical protein [Gemmatimonadota bacterium]NIU73946.1 hypothetical protein [Gammaproteobacteria bacterium]
PADPALGPAGPGPSPTPAPGGRDGAEYGEYRGDGELADALRSPGSASGGDAAVELDVAALGPLRVRV